MRFIIRMRGDYAVKFHTNCCGASYSQVADDDATIFFDADKAIETALAHGIMAKDIALRHAPEPCESEVAA